MNNKRKIWVDILRIFACFLVIVNHSIGVYDLVAGKGGIKGTVVIIMFCLCKMAVPLFLVITGFFSFDKEDGYTNLTRKIFRTVIIILFWGGIYKLVLPYMEGYRFNVESVRAIVWAMISKPPSWHMWYLYALLGIYMVLPLIRKIVWNMNKKDIYWFIALWISYSGIISYMLPMLGINVNISPYFELPLISGCVALVIMGYIIKSLEVSKKNLIISLVLFGIMFIINFGAHFIYSKNEGVGTRAFDSYLNFPTMMMACSLLYIFNYFQRDYAIRNDCINKAIVNISQCTFGIYLVHPIFLKFFANNNYVYMVLGNWSESIHRTIVVEIATFILSIIGIYLFRKIPVIGKYLC